MSRLEGKTKPILEPLIFGDRLETELTPADQKTLAYWAIKTALTSDLERPVRMYPPSLYTHLFELHDPFPHALVWTAAYGTGGPDQIGSHVEPLSFTGLHADRSIFGTIDTDSIKMAGTLTTISLFRVLFQVFLFEWDKLPATYMIEAANTPGPIRRIWPTSDTFIWPPDLLALKDDAAFRRFTQRRPNLRGRPRK